MFFGPIFTRECTIVPRRERTFLLRGLYCGLLFLIVATAWLVVTGTQVIRDTGDFARFATALFQFVAPLQLVLCLFFSAMFAASAVAQEKERQTMVLLLLTRMSNEELVLGKLMAAILNVIFMLAVSVPIFMMIAILGGVSNHQIVRVLAVSFLTGLAAGSLGSCVAFAREKTFQAIAVSVLLMVLWIAVWEVVSFGMTGGGKHWGGLSVDTIVAAASPWQAILVAARPVVSAPAAPILSQWLPVLPFILLASGITVLINGYTIVMVRIWNPSREARPTTIEEDTWRKVAQTETTDTLADSITGAKVFAADSLVDTPAFHAGLLDVATLTGRKHRRATHSVERPIAPCETYSSKHGENHNVHVHGKPGKSRRVWDNPIIWREMCTRAYGRKNLIIRFTYLLFFMMAATGLWWLQSAAPVLTVAQLAGTLVPLFLLSLVLVNAQAITSLTSERDGKTFDLLLVSDITPKEFVFGKLGGVFYNMKEMVVLPLGLCGTLYGLNLLTFWPFVFLTVGLLTLYIFVAMIGVHIGMQYDNTRSAVATSLGIVFFLFVGIASCIWMMVAFSGSFEAQFAPFLAFMVGGAIGLYVTLGARNPSSAIACASFILPPITFYAITSFFLTQYHLVFLSLLGAYGFAVLAMFIPAVAEFDVATGRTTLD